MNNKKIIVVSIIIIASLIGSIFISPLLFLGLWALFSTVGFLVLFIKYLNETNEYEDLLDQHIEDTEEVIDRITRFTSQEIIQNNDEIKSIIAYLRSYLQQLITYINTMTSRNDNEEE